MQHDVGSDRGLLYGEACFETVRVIDGAIFAWKEHEARLARGLAAFGLPCPEGLLAQCLAAAREAGRDALLRLTVSGGEAPRGLLSRGPRRPVVHIRAWPWQAPAQPLRLRTLYWPMGGMARIAKFTSDYAYTIRLLRQAHHDGLLDANEAALFTAESELLCMETGNILIRVDGQWWTPDSTAILPGIVREALVQAGVVRAGRCPVDWLAGCEALAICNSGSFVRPVSMVNGRLPDSSPELFDALFNTLRGRKGVPEEIACA